MWSTTGADARGSLAVSVPAEACRRLGDACIHAPELVDAFGLFALSIRSPEAFEPRHLADACRRICQWAEERSCLPAATLFAEAAASVDPGSPALAPDAARLCRQAARFERAASWYERAFGLAVRTRSRAEAVRALLGYGNLMKDLGEFEKARLVFERVARRALNTGRRRVAAEAHHSLLTLAAESGTFGAAVRHLRKALDYYPVHHPFIPYLVHDFAFVLVRNRHYGLAVGPLAHLLTVIRKPHEQVLVYGTLARAAGGIRSRNQYREAEEAILRLVEQHQQFASSALNGLAEGAWAFGDWDRAEVHATAALAVARARQDGSEQRVSEGILESVARKDAAPLEMDPEGRQRIEFLLQRLLSRLRAWEAPDRAASHAAHSSAA
jgi:tetratricopeptide (TPR) repeat protein